MSNSTRCAACKSLRRRCSQDCVLAPYFPGNNPERFSCVHRIFGASNITKILERLPAHARADAAECMVLEASSRIQDPVYGCTRMISQLQQEIIQTQYEIGKIQGEIAFHSAQQQIQIHQFGEPSWVNTAANATASDQLQGRSHLDDHQPHLGDFHPQTHF